MKKVLCGSRIFVEMDGHLHRRSFGEELANQVGPDETVRNPRARSARLRAAERTSAQPFMEARS